MSLEKHIEGLRKALEALLFSSSPSSIEEEILAVLAMDWEAMKFVPQGAKVRWSGDPEEPAFLKKGSVFGDPLLDGAFLTGREVVLRYPRVKVTLRGKVNEKGYITLFKMTMLNFEWEGEEASFVGGPHEGYLSCDLVLEQHPGARLIRKGAEAILREDLSRKKDPLSRKLYANLLLTPKMRALLETLLETQDPLKALGDEDFFRQVSLRLLSFF